VQSDAITNSHLQAAAARGATKLTEPASIRTPSPPDPPPIDVKPAAVPVAAADTGNNFTVNSGRNTNNTWFDDSESEESDPEGFFGISI